MPFDPDKFQAYKAANALTPTPGGFNPLKLAAYKAGAPTPAPTTTETPPNPGFWARALVPPLQAAKTVLGAPLEAMARVGRFANQGNQALASLMAEKGGQYGGSVGGMAGAIAGTALGTASEFLLPQTKLGAAFLPLPFPSPSFLFPVASQAGSGAVAKAAAVGHAYPHCHQRCGDRAVYR